MGGLVGGAFATGMSAAELRKMIADTDWDAMFGSSSFPFKNLRRKEDARSYPSRLEFGLKRSIVPPTSLNDGQQVDLFLARIAAPYYDLATFDDLPTPFRVVAVDLLKAEKVVLDSGPLATALRATMSLPGAFPPVQRDGRVLVDGGALDNIPADVVKGLGASRVIAIDVGYAPSSTVNYSMFGLMSQTVDVMMRTATRAALESADLTIAVDVEGFGSLDWRRADELIERGYQAAEKHRDDLMKLRASEDEWQAWVASRQQRRRTGIPEPAFLKTEGVVQGDARTVERTFARHLKAPVDIAALEKDLSSLSGLDRYQSVTWKMTTVEGQAGILVSAQRAYRRILRRAPQRQRRCRRSRTARSVGQGNDSARALGCRWTGQPSGTVTWSARVNDDQSHVFLTISNGGCPDQRRPHPGGTRSLVVSLSEQAHPIVCRVFGRNVIR
jgi:NTE family protein